MRYQINSTEWGDYYVIPVNKVDEFSDWHESVLEDDSEMVIPEYATEVEPTMISFENWRKSA